MTTGRFTVKVLWDNWVAIDSEIERMASDGADDIELAAFEEMAASLQSRISEIATREHLDLPGILGWSKQTH